MTRRVADDIEGHSVDPWVGRKEAFRVDAGWHGFLMVWEVTMQAERTVRGLRLSTRRVKWLLPIGATALMLAAASAIAYASVPVTFVTGGPLHAADLNNDLTSLDGRISTLETASSTYATASQLTMQISTVQAEIAALQKPTAISANLKWYSVSGTALAAPCVASGAIVDCTCPSGSFVVSGGAAASDATGDTIRESRPISTTAWRATCVSGTTNVLCANYEILCSIVGP